MRARPFAIAIAIVAAGLSIPAARAQVPVEPGAAGAAVGAAAEGRGTGPLWELGLGAAAVQLPDYRGSDQSKAYLLPLPYVVYRGRWLRADRDGARALLVETDRVKVDISLAASVPTRSRDNVARQGMPDLAPSVEFGPNLNVELMRSADGRLRLDLRLPVRAALTVERSPDAIGATFSPNLNLDIRGVGGGWNVGLLAGPLYGDRKYHDYYYGVGPAYATPQRPAYRAPAGYAGWRALAATSRRIGPAWVGAFLRYDDLRGAAFDASPLLRRAHQVTVGLGVSWVFAASGQQVRSED